ncbi:NUDIX hydrolase [Haloplasma contractile]|uniref:Isopentenyl-diphosphate delta-isomerase protein n=1 Tax=Haloplasma contractile SSD-17B TaxID=1033810 RepID=U2DRJ3_9MOLU|nr:NUDIX domain-containing protein [Haloplasma contractile]ERJ11197.1 isopentenyl-diphosphate delta-isomerase protein [Haloplasma contractile SSD-17B]
MEIRDLYTMDRQKTGITNIKGDPLKEGEYIIIVHVWITNHNNEILIQKRQPWKKWYPNLWDCSVVGGALSGEDTVDTAIREAKEELSIELEAEDINILFTHKTKHCFYDICLVQKDIDIKKLNLQHEEVADIKWATKDEIVSMIKGDKFVKTDYLEKVFDAIE